MTGIPVVKSKLIMPQLANSFIMSNRINELCKSMHSQNAVVITAPAGYGKTTLMIAALNIYRLDSRVCWYRLEQEDREPAVFYAHFIEALFPEGEMEFTDSRSILAAYGDIHSQYKFLNAAICQKLWDFYKHSPGTRTFIVLDDFQQVKDLPEITSTIQYLVNNLPENCSIFISSRSDTDLITVKQSLEKNILRISREELCFSEKELVKLFTKIYGFEIDQKLIQKIVLNTEGWAAGIIMLGQVLSKRNSGVKQNILKISGEKDYLFKYFAVEVFKTADPQLMLFMVKAAILREFTAAEAGAILNTYNALQLLDLCEKKGLFIQKIIGEVTSYRFHGLFREVLLQIQPEFITEEEINNYHLRAAAYYSESKVIERAIEHYVACGSSGRAAELILKESASLDPYKPIEQLRSWLKFLPDHAVKNNSIIFYIKSHICLEGEEDLAELTEETLLNGKGYTYIATHMKALIIFSYFFVSRNDVHNIIKTLNQAPATLKHTRNKSLKGNLIVFNLMKAFWEESFSKGINLSQKVNSYQLDQDWEWMALAYSCKLHFFLGELDTAENYINKAFKLDLFNKNDMIKSIAMMLYAYVLYLKKDRASFSKIKDDLMAIGEKYHFDLVLGQGKRLAALTSYSEHDLDAALELLESSTNHFERLGNQAMIPYNKLSRCLWLSREINAGEMLAEAKELYKILTSLQPGFCILDIGQSILGALAREAGDYELAREALMSASKNCKAKKTKQILCGTYLHLAKLYYDTGDHDKGKATLKQSFGIASSNSYFMFWDLHLPTLVEMSARCVKSGVYNEYAIELMSTYFGREAAEFFKRHAAVTEESNLKEFCGAFISLYGIKKETPSPLVYVNLLGRFSIAVNGSVIPENSWKTKKIEGILKYLILHRGRVITREILMELFWPGSDKKSASMSLRAALYELRKVLKNHGVPLEEKYALIHEKSGGLIVPASGILAVDIDEFLSLHDRIKGLPFTKATQVQRMSILGKMVSLYRGNLLEDELYEDWTFFTREELKSIYIESALSLAADYVEIKENEKAEKLLLQTLAADPYNEEACLFLIKLYVYANQRGRAIKLYNNFEVRIMKDLNIKPDERLASVVRDIT